MAWYVMRDLKRANALEPAWKVLSGLGFRVFTPMRNELVSRYGRRVSELRAVMPDLLFVESERAPLDAVVARIPTLQYRYVRGQGAGAVMQVRDADMERFMSALSGDYGEVRFYTPDEITPSMIGREIRIIGGALDGQRVRLLSKRGLRFPRLLVELPGILTATVTVTPEMVEMV